MQASNTKMKINITFENVCARNQQLLVIHIHIVWQTKSAYSQIKTLMNQMELLASDGQTMNDNPPDCRGFDTCFTP